MAIGSRSFTLSCFMICSSRNLTGPLCGFPYIVMNTCFYLSAGEANGSPRESLGGDHVRIVHSQRCRSPTLTPRQP